MKADFKPFCSPLCFRNGTASIFFASNVTPLHTHNTLQFVFDLTGSFLFRTNKDGWREYRALIVKENIAHQLNTNGSLQLILYIDTGSDAAKTIKARYLIDTDCREPNIVFSPVEEVLFHENLIQSKKSLRVLVDLILDKLTGKNDDGADGGRIGDVLTLIKNSEPGNLSIDYLANHACISPSRLRMQFKQETGVPLHHYLIRHKLLFAITAIINGSSIQDAAYGTGFNDTSHFHKLMLKTFGIGPSAFIKQHQTGFIVSGDGSMQLESTLVQAF
jgi:AraC-like DNA-binding protein